MEEAVIFTQLILNLISIINKSLVASQASIVLVLLEVTLDLSEQVLFDLGWHKGATLGQHLLDQVVKVDLLQALAPDQVCMLVRERQLLTETVLLELLFPSAFDESLPEVLFELGLLAAGLEFLLDEALLEGDVVLGAASTVSASESLLHIPLD